MRSHPLPPCRMLSMRATFLRPGGVARVAAPARFLSGTGDKRPPHARSSFASRRRARVSLPQWQCQ